MTALQVWTPADEAPDDRLTMREAFGRYVRPSISGRRAAATARQYETALRHWERFCTSGGESEDSCASTYSTRATLTGGGLAGSKGIDDVRRIDDAMLEAFGLNLSNGGLSADTVNKTWKFLRVILRRIGPRESRNPRAVGLIDRVPSMEPVLDPDGSESDGQATIFSKSQLAALVDACDVADWPQPHAPAIWRAWIVLATCLGPRVEDCSAWTWDAFRLDGASPVPSSTMRWDPGYVAWVPNKTKRAKQARLILPLPTCCRKQLDRLRSLGINGPTIYGWQPGARDQRRHTWKLIAAQAGVPDAARKSFRPTCNVMWNRASKSGLGRWVLGHAARDVNDAAYMRAEPELIAHADLLDLPESFSRCGNGFNQPFLF